MIFHDTVHVYMLKNCIGEFFGTPQPTPCMPTAFLKIFPKFANFLKIWHTDEKENEIFLIYKEIQRVRGQSHV
jgi:hypothetical protein